MPGIAHKTQAVIKNRNQERQQEKDSPEDIDEFFGPGGKLMEKEIETDMAAMNQRIGHGDHDAGAVEVPLQLFQDDHSALENVAEDNLDDNDADQNYIKPRDNLPDSPNKPIQTARN